jgi:predicted nucleotidyltransferase
VSHCFIGAIVPELLLDVPPVLRTNDADAVVLLPTLDAFEQLKAALAQDGFAPTSQPYRLKHQSGGWVDLIPFSAALAPRGVLTLARDLSFNVAGLDLLARHALAIAVDEGLTIQLAPLPLYVLLKLVAYSDRGLAKDPASVLHCLKHYEETSERRYGLDHHGELVSYDVTTAYLLGQDARVFLSRDLRAIAASSVAPLVDLRSTQVAVLARETGRPIPSDADRNEVARLFHAFWEGAGLADRPTG